MKNAVLFSSKSEEWETPQHLFDRLNAIYQFKLDACATARNAKCPVFFSKEENSLEQDWAPFGRIWLNPPYGRAIAQFMRKALEESRKGCLVVCLVPARTDTKWWHDYVLDKGHVTFIRGRLRFKRTDAKPGAPIYPAPFPSAIVSYLPGPSYVVDAPRIRLPLPAFPSTLSHGRPRPESSHVAKRDGQGF